MFIFSLLYSCKRERTRNPMHAGNLFPLTSASFFYHIQKHAEPHPKAHPNHIRATSEPHPSHILATSEILAEVKGKEVSSTNADRGPLSAFSHKAPFLAPQYSPIFYVFKLSKHYKNGAFALTYPIFLGIFCQKWPFNLQKKPIRIHGQVLRTRVSVESFR